jgi:DNA topoisomerase-2
MIEDIREYHQENRVHFIVKCPRLRELTRKEGIVKFFKLQGSLSASNQVLFNDKGQIYRYKYEQDIVKEWFGLRSTLYELRKAFMLAKLKKEHEMLVNKVRFIKGVIEETIQIKRVKRKEIVK